VKKIIIINGYPRSGKDLFAEYLKQILHSQYKIKTTIISSVQQVKKAAELLGWNGEKTEINRNALSDLKDLSTKYWDGPFNLISSHIRQMGDNECLVFMIREPAEIKKVANDFPQTITVFIENKNSIKADNHADSNVENYDYDFKLNNNKTKEDLFELTNTFIKVVLYGRE